MLVLYSIAGLINTTFYLLSDYPRNTMTLSLTVLVMTCTALVCLVPSLWMFRESRERNLQCSRDVMELRNELKLWKTSLRVLVRIPICCRNLQEPLYPDVLCVLLMVLLLISIDVILHLQENSSDRKLLLEEYATKTELEDLKANMSCKNTFLLSIFIKSRFY